MTQAKLILPKELTGPRSYFTDLERRDPNYRQTKIIRKLKLQLLTKKNITIAASSLFHHIGFSLFSTDPGLTKALQKGIVLPALRDDFNGIAKFFDDRKKDDEYSHDSFNYFSSNTGAYVHWNLVENATWFQKVFFDNLTDTQSFLRSQLSFSDVKITDLLGELDDIVVSKPEGKRFLDRGDVARVASKMGEVQAAYLESFARLIYRISGARIVNSEGHFPQSNLIDLGLVENERQLADQRIFWELYVEAIISHITSAARLSEERLDNLSFEDILKIREGLFDIKFAETFDTLMKKAKEDVCLHDPNKLLMTQDEMFTVASRLERILDERIKMELGVPDDKSNNLLQLGSTIELCTGGVLFGIVGALKAIPEITALASPKLADAMVSRVNSVKSFISSKTGWNQKQKRALLSGYTSLLTYGLPKIK